MKATIAICAVLLAGLVAGCGGAGKSTGTDAGSSSASSGATVAGGLKDSPDLDRDANTDDDTVVLDFGHAASASELREITNLLKRYFAAAAAANGAEGCRMFAAVIAESVVEDYGRAPSSPDVRGNSCAAVMSKLYDRQRQQLRLKSRTLVVTGARVEGDRGLGLMRFTTMSEPRKITLRREGSRWKIRDLFDTGMP